MPQPTRASRRQLSEMPTNEPTAQSVPQHRSFRGIKVLFFLIIILLAAMGGAWLYYYVDQKLQRQPLESSKQIVLHESEVVAHVAKEASPSVVSILVGTTSVYGQETGAGTGIIISKDGYILTNKHVVPEDTDSITVITADDKVYENVDWVGSDPLNDIAFLKIKNVNNLAPAAIGDSSKMAIGQKVIAIGNALGQYETTVTSGIISGKGRPVNAASATGAEVESLSNLFQTDAAINPGNSGGPLLNINGEVIGINTAIAEEAEGIGFAIPINDARGVIKSVLENGEVKRPYLGVKYITLSYAIAEELNLEQKNGAYLDPNQESVVPGGPAAKAGVRPGDIITKIGGTAISKQQVLTCLISQYAVGDKVQVTVLRDGKEQNITVTLEEYK